MSLPTLANMLRRVERLEESRPRLPMAQTIRQMTRADIEERYPNWLAALETFMATHGVDILDMTRRPDLRAEFEKQHPKLD